MKSLLAALGGAQPHRGGPVPKQAQGTYCCFVREIRYWFGPRAGETVTLDDGNWELQVITQRHLLWEYEDANSVHNGQALDLDYRPRGVDQLVARRQDGSLVLRIALDPSAETTRFCGLGSHAAFSGICYFNPLDTP